MKKTILTGIKPTGVVHIGNYFGAIKPALNAITDDCDCYFFIADYHALNTIKNKEVLKNYVEDVACVWLGCGLDEKNVCFYKQSAISEICELSVLLSNVTPKGLLNRAHAYKAILEENRQKKLDDDASVNMGLFNYPLLMTADILAMNANFVPVGQDQKQHIEIARDIAKYFNNTYGKMFVLPEEILDKNTNVIDGLDGRKMSKSYNNIIPLFLDDEKLKKSIMQIKTDSTLPNEKKDKNSLVFKYYSLFASKEEIENFSKQFDEGISWAQAKIQLFEVAKRSLLPIREKYLYYKSNPQLVEKILKDGALKASKKAKETLEKVKELIGINLKKAF